MIAIFVSHLFVGVISAVTNESIAGGHYRIGTLNQSFHYKDDEDLNSSHNGIYFVHNNNAFGTYLNSESEQSFFYLRNSQLNETFSFSYGIVTGYEFGTLPMVGISAQFNILKFTFTPEAAVIGLEFPVF